MAFLVEEKPQKGNESKVIERLDLELLAIGKRSGLSFSEINELRSRDLIAYAELYIGNGIDKQRQATQSDIDNLFA